MSDKKETPEDKQYILTDMSGLAIFVDKETYDAVMASEKQVKGVKKQNEN